MHISSIDSIHGVCYDVIYLIKMFNKMSCVCFNWKLPNSCLDWHELYNCVCVYIYIYMIEHLIYSGLFYGNKFDPINVWVYLILVVKWLWLMSSDCIWCMLEGTFNIWISVWHMNNLWDTNNLISSIRFNILSHQRF